LFPNAPEPFIDLSTGINPNPYPLPRLPPEAFTRLPDADAVERLAAVAARAYGAPEVACVVASPGSQLLLPLVMRLAAPGDALILGPTYAEHARAAAIAGHTVYSVSQLDQARDAALIIVTNPNNPDGRIFSKEYLLNLSCDLQRKGGVLIVDEAFMDVGPEETSLAGEVLRGNIVVLRSFGKFYGLAGLRLGFAVAAPQTAQRLRAWLGPWAVSGPALAAGEIALADEEWADAARSAVRKSAERLDALLTQAKFEIAGGTALFRLVRTDAAAEIFQRLGSAGILVRRFSEYPTWLRFGIPGAESAWERLHACLAQCD
jgi:cobalamin biosynthetic protein CobC